MEAAKTPPRHHRDIIDAPTKTPPTRPRPHRDTTETRSRRHQDITETARTPPRHHRDTTETPPKYHKNTTKNRQNTNETPPRHTAQAGSRKPDGAHAPLELTTPSYRYWGKILSEPAIKHFARYGRLAMHA